MSKPQDLQAIFSPKSIAVIGVSQTKADSIGNTVLKNLIESGFQGELYPINPRASEIMARKCYPNVSAVPGPVDMAVYCVPEDKAVEAAKDCAKKGVKANVIITSGFSEVGNTAAENQILEIARSANARVVGPNIVGVLLNASKANASFAPCLPFQGKTALISQSGALLIALDMATFVRRFGISSMICLGNMSDIDFSDCVDYFAGDENTSCISLYIEGLKNGRRFIEAGRKACKPIIALKAGVSAHGAAAAASHTGSLAGSVKVYDAAFKQAHVIRANNLDELLDCSQALSMQPPMKGENIIVITNGGGIGVLSSDAAEAYGVPLKTTPEDLQVEFRKCMPDFGSPKNPVDITGGQGVAGYQKALAAALKSDWVHGIAILYCETAVTKPVDIAEGLLKTVAEHGKTDKPIVCCFVGGDECVKGGAILGQNSIPTFDSPSKTMSALSALRQIAKFQAEGSSTAFRPFPDVDQARARKIIEEAKKNGRAALTEPEAKEVFSAYGLPVAPGILAKTEDEAVAAAEKIKYPVVMKIVSPQIIHKSDAGGVKVHIKDADEVRKVFKLILENARNYKADAEIHGVLVQEMAMLGTEVIVGSVNDATFGPTVMFGLGGIFVEALKDVTFRVAPFSPEAAMGMFPEIRAYPILQGTRGAKPRDQKALSGVVARLSQMVTDLGDLVAETDANPIMLYEEGRGLKVVDARIILK